MAIDLKPHNVEAYDKVKENFTRSNRVAVIHPTGTGKSYLALKMLEENKERKAIYIAPTNAILHNVKKTIFESGMDMKDFPNLKRITYTKLASLSDEEIENLASEIIVLDEFHHCGAPEWGAGVDRLLDISSDANILGLSATPIRYNDGYRDMAEELFDSNVASEMTLEEAIEREILPGATYVSALYSYTDELENMQEQIEQIHDEDNKKKAQRLFQELKGKLDDNTQNLPELLSSHMTNRSGKYIVFCKNIEDMRQKIEESKNIFSQVNTNITTYDVASDRTLEKNEDTLKSFENDNNQETLKLLFAVDMLNEGYHINDLDGVVMMRPTFSPTIFVQQLGRALSAGVDKDKSPVILDLVDNFDSCKIIEDFCERMKQYKNTNGIKEDNSDEKSKLSIFDTTKEFREIANKINDLSKKKKISIEQKIEIFERFKETGEELTGKTIYQGYPIGEWGISIRATINSGNASYTPEIREKLNSLGVLERQIEATIDERIQFIVDWNNKYPKAKLAKGKTIPEEILREYSNSGEEYNELLKEYQKANRYFTYVIDRYYRGKLTKEQKETVRNSNINKKFGYSDEINSLAEQYRISPEKITYIIDKYGDMESFKKAYKDGQLDENDEKVLRDNLKRAINIGKSENKNMDRLQRAICRPNNIVIYNSDELIEKLQNLSPNEKKFIDLRFGLGDDIPKTLEELGNEFNTTSQRIRQIEARVLRKLSRVKTAINVEESYNYSQAKERNYMVDKIFDSNIIFYPDEDYSHIPRDIDKEDLTEFSENAKSPREDDDLREIGRIGGLDLSIEIEKLGLSIRTYNILKRSGINTIGQIASLTEDEFKKVRNLGVRGVEETYTKVKSFVYNKNEYNVDDAIEKIEEELNRIKQQNEKNTVYKMKYDFSDIDAWGLSTRTYNVLRRSLTDEQITSLTKDNLPKLRGLGKKSLQELESKLNIIKEDVERKKCREQESAEYDKKRVSVLESALKKLRIAKENGREFMSEAEMLSADYEIAEKAEKIKQEQTLVDEETNIDNIDSVTATLTESRKKGSESIEQTIEIEDTTQENNELEELRKHKMELQKQVMALESQVTAAKELLASYEKIIESKEFNDGHVQE